jgi:hypothetical protein
MREVLVQKVFGSESLMDLELLRLAGLHPQRETLQQIRLEEAFGADLHPHEIAHAKPNHPGVHSDGPEWDNYFKASGKAHHHGHAANEISAMIKSGEIGGEEGHHQNAHYAHQQAMELHHHAGEMALRAGAPWMKQTHGSHAAEHEKMMVKHGKKFKKQ